LLLARRGCFPAARRRGGGGAPARRPRGARNGGPDRGARGGADRALAGAGGRRRRGDGADHTRLRATCDLRRTTHRARHRRALLPRARRLDGPPARWWPAAGLAMGLAALTKGPVGVVVPLLAWAAA